MSKKDCNSGMDCLSEWEKQGKSQNGKEFLSSENIRQGGGTSDCLKCGRCEHSCPQHLPVRKLLEEEEKELQLQGKE